MTLGFRLDDNGTLTQRYHMSWIQGEKLSRRKKKCDREGNFASESKTTYRVQWQQNCDRHVPLSPLETPAPPPNGYQIYLQKQNKTKQNSLAVGPCWKIHSVLFPRCLHLPFLQVGQWCWGAEVFRSILRRLPGFGKESHKEHTKIKSDKDIQMELVWGCSNRPKVKYSNLFSSLGIWEKLKWNLVESFLWIDASFCIEENFTCILLCF